MSSSVWHRFQVSKSRMLLKELQSGRIYTHIYIYICIYGPNGPWKCPHELLTICFTSYALKIMSGDALGAEIWPFQFSVEVTVMLELHLSNVPHYELIFVELQLFWTYICRTSLSLNLHLSNFTYICIYGPISMYIKGFCTFLPGGGRPLEPQSGGRTGGNPIILRVVNFGIFRSGLRALRGLPLTYSQKGSLRAPWGLPIKRILYFYAPPKPSKNQ